MEPNRELFKKIYDQITTDPKSHDQMSWTEFAIDGSSYSNEFAPQQNPEDCGTTRCVGGWALHFCNPGQSIFKTIQDLTGGMYIEKAAAQVLGLEADEAGALFSADDPTAVALVRHYAGLED